MIAALFNLFSCLLLATSFLFSYKFNFLLVCFQLSSFLKFSHFCRHLLCKVEESHYPLAQASSILFLSDDDFNRWKICGIESTIPCILCSYLHQCEAYLLCTNFALLWITVQGEEQQRTGQHWPDLLVVGLTPVKCNSYFDVALKIVWF